MLIVYSIGLGIATQTHQSNLDWLIGAFSGIIIYSIMSFK